MENVKKEFDVFPLSLSFIIYQQFSTEIFILLSKINVIKSAFRAKQKYIMYVKRVDDRWKMIFYRLARDDAMWIKRKIKKKTRMIQWMVSTINTDNCKCKLELTWTINT